jgi:phospholipase C
MVENAGGGNGRREFLRLSAAGAIAGGFTSTSIRRALALPANRQTGTIEDIQHVVVLMQENRSFDHYYGTLRGVRGHNDRVPVRLPGGKPVWFQPRQHEADQHITPFHLDTSSTGAQAVTMLDHTWGHTQAAFAAGRYNAWPAHKTNMTMGHFTRKDIPFHFELADAFTICDQYFCSIPASTHPNRMFLMTGTNDPTGAGGGPLLDNVDVVDNPEVPPFTWTTYPERLQQAGISWQVYQQGLTWKDPENGNYGLNVLQNFKQFIDAPEGSELQKRGFAVRSLDQFATDAAAGQLPQVSWLMPPAMFSEHPKYMPAYGATYISRVLDALTANPEVWSRTTLLVMYDENDGYFDHAVPPMPPTSALPGKSTVSTDGEVHQRVNPAHKPLYKPDMLPYGLGPRVPMLAISPWSKGGFVCSQVFDHTSVIRFIESRFGVVEPNISPWRRAVCGDLTTAFDFARPDVTPPRLPSTSQYRAKADAEITTLPPPTVPAVDAGLAIMGQEDGVRPARPLPYALEVTGHITEAGLALRFDNTGRQGASFIVTQDSPDDPTPHRYTVGAGEALEDSLAVTDGAFAVAVHGPNGFYRRFSGVSSTTLSALRVGTLPASGRGMLVVRLANSSPTPVSCRINDTAYGGKPRTLIVPAHGTLDDAWEIATSHHWYDLTVTAGNSTWRMAGHVENGQTSFSDPAAVAPVLTLA